eukprot:6666822-Alexandrium_andersonii.AAC.1
MGWLPRSQRHARSRHSDWGKGCARFLGLAQEASLCLEHRASAPGAPAWSLATPVREDLPPTEVERADGVDS